MTLFLATLFLFGLAVPGMAITVEMVTVGDPGNGADTNGLGDVAYEYRIGKYEVTVAQYTEFLNSVAATDSNSLYNTRMATNNNVSGIGRSGSSGSYTYNVITRLSAPTNSANFPIAFVSWFDAARFVNWLANGATNGASTETGTYTLANWTNGNAVARNATNPNTGLPPTFWLPTEDEWHKAAFYKGGGTNAGYWGYPTQSDAVPTNNIDFPGETNQANYRPAPDNRFTVNQSATYSPNVHYLTTVGFFSNSPGPYGNFDMGGNLNEWTDGTNTLRWARGGSWSNTVVPLQSSCSLQLFFADTETSIIGFRVAGVAARGDNANLAALVLGGGTLTPAFAADTTNFAVHVSQTVTNITLRPTVAAPGATLAVNGTNLVSGSTRSIGLSLGANSIITVVTAPDGLTTRSYAVTVYRLTDKPTLNSLPNLTIAEDSSEQSVALAGIAAGDGPGQPRALKLIATSSNTNVVPHPTITYSSPDSTGTLAFTPRPERSGNATITVTVEDGGPDGDTNTATGNETFSRTFTVTVTPVNDLPTFNALPDLTVAQDSGAQTVPLAGINAGPQETQPLRVTASSSQPGLIPNPVVTYTSPQAAGSLRFTPQAGVAGSAVVTVRVEDGGPDSNLNTVGDNQVFTRTFTVTVTASTSNANLAGLVPNVGTLNPTFAVTNTNYSLDVSNPVSFLRLTPTLADESATVSVDGTNVTSGIASSPLALGVGTNLIPVTVTAQNGSTTRTYSIRAVRAPLGLVLTNTNPLVTAAGYVAGGPLSISLRTNPSPGQVIKVVDNTSSDPVAGTFAGLAEGGEITATNGGNTFRFAISYVGGDGNDITLTRTAGPGQVNHFVTTFAGSSEGNADGTGAGAQFAYPYGAAVDAAGNVYVADFSNSRIRKVTAAGVVTTFAGSDLGYADGAGTNAKFYNPRGVAVDAVGNVYVADSQNNRIRKVTASGVVTTLAGSSSGYTNGTGTNAKFSNPRGVAVDAVGNVYVADFLNSRIRKVTAAGVVTTLAGSGVAGYADGNGTNAQFSSPYGLAVDGSGNVYVADYGNNLIRKVDTNGEVTTLAGSGVPGYADGTGTNAQFYEPMGMAVDPVGNVYVADSQNNRIRKVTAAGVVTTLAGSDLGYADGTGTNAQFASPRDVAVDAVGNVYVGDSYNHRIRKIASGYLPILTLGPATQSGLTLRLTGTVNPNGFLTTARFLYGTNSNSLNLTSNVAFTSTNGTNALTVTSTISSGLTLGRTYFYRLTASNVDGVANTEVGSILMRNTNANLSALQTIGGTLAPTFTATTTNYTVNLSNAVSLFSLRPTLADSNATVAVNGAAVTSGNSSIPTTLNVGTNFFTNVVTAQDGVSIRTYRVAVVRAPMSLNLSNGAAGLTASNGYVASGPLNLTLGFAPTPGQVITLVNNTSGNATTGIFNGLLEGATVTATNGGNTFRFAISYAGGDGNDITLTRILNPGQVKGYSVTTLAGSGVAGYADGSGTNAAFNNPAGVTVDFAGNVYVADVDNHRIRKVLTNGVVTTLAGSSGGYADGSGTNAAFNYPAGVTVDAVGNVYLADSGNHRIRKATAAGVVTTLAGSDFGYADGTGTSAQFNGPSGLAVDGLGNVYVADYTNHRIRKVDTNGEVTTLAGGAYGYADGSGTNAQFLAPVAVAVDSVGNLYVADLGNHRIRKVDTNGVVTTLAGSSSGYADGPGATAQFKFPSGVAVDLSGNVYVGDYSNHRIRKVDTNGVVTTFAGSGIEGYADCSGPSAQFNCPWGVAVDSEGIVYVGDHANRRIRKISFVGMIPISTLGAATQSGLTLRLTGTVNPNGFLTTARFLYGTNSNSLNLTSNVALTSSNGTNALTVTGTISTGLALGRTYFYRLTASNVDGVANTEVGSILLRNTNTSLSNLVAVGGALTPGFAPVTTNYTVIVSNTVSFFSLRPTLADSNASVTVNGSPVTSGSNSVPAALALGTNLFTNVVTAQDGSSTRTYRVTVVRAGLPALTNTTNALVTANGYAAGGSLNLTLGFAPTPGQMLTLVNNSSGDPVAGTFTGLTNGATVTATNGGNTFRFAISYTGGDGNDITLTRDGGRAVFTLAGGGGPDLLGSGCIDGTGTNAAFSRPNGLAVDGSGNVYVADTFNHRIRKVTPAGEVTTVAGAGTGGGFANGVGTNAAFYSPYGLALDASGNLYVADTYNHLIRQIRLADGNVTTLAGGGPGFTNNGIGASASFRYPRGLVADDSGFVYVADNENNQIRCISIADSNVFTLAGSSIFGSDDGTGLGATFGLPIGVALGGGNNLYVLDNGSSDPSYGKIRMIQLSNSNVTTLAGGGNSVDGTGTNASFSGPLGLAIDASGNLYVADTGRQTIRKVTSNGVVGTVAGSGTIDYIDGPAAQAAFYDPVGVAVDGSGTIYVADNGNHVIRKITEGFRPVLTLGAATRSATNLVLTGTVNPNGFVTTARFLYGTNRTNLNLTSNLTLTPNNGTNALAVTSTITLSSITNSPRFFRLTASNIDGVASSAVTPLTIVSVARDGLGNTFLQVTGAAPGSTGGGNATGATRTLYFYASDSSASPSYVGTAWPHVMVTGQLVAGPGVTATLSTSAAGGLLVNGRPVYQYINDTGATTAAGVGTFWPGIQASGASTTTAASGALNP